MKKLLSILLALLIAVSCVSAVSAATPNVDPNRTPGYSFESILDAICEAFNNIVAAVKEFLRGSSEPPMLIGKNEEITIDRVNCLVYGFVNNESLTNRAAFDAYIDVKGRGYLDIIPVPEQGYGTGTIINVRTKNGDITESFRVVIFGDLNGDSLITYTDTIIVRDEVFFATSWSVPNDPTYKSYWIMAADLAKDGVIDSADVNEIRNVVLVDREIDQVNGVVIYTL